MSDKSNRGFDDDEPMGDFPPSSHEEPGGFSDLEALEEVSVKVARGKSPIILIVVLLGLIAGGAAVGYYAYADYKDFHKWEAQVKAAVKMKDGERQPVLREIMAKATSKDIQAQVALELGLDRDTEAVDLLIKGVSQGGEVAHESAMALARIGNDKAKTAVDAIFAQLQAADGATRAELGWALCQLGDERGFTPVLDGITQKHVTTKTLPGYSSAVVLRVASTEKMMQLVESKYSMLRTYAAMELGYRKDKDPIPSLLTLIKDQDDGVAEAAAVALARFRDARVPVALIDVMQRKPNLKEVILSSVAQSVGAPALEMIYRKTTHDDDRFKIISKLKVLRDPRSKDLLLEVAKAPMSDMTGLENPAVQLSDGDKVKLAVAQMNDTIRNQALWTLEELGDPRIADLMAAKAAWVAKTKEQIPDDALRYQQNDMLGRVANNTPSWFGTIKPENAGDHLMKIYDDNKPYENTPECAQRVKVDIGPLMDGMGHSGDMRFCAIAQEYLYKDDGFNSQAASTAIGRLKCKGAAEDFLKRIEMSAVERKDGKFAQLLENRDFQMENRLQERRNSIVGLGLIGDPKANEKLLAIALDPVDDQELRQEAAKSAILTADDKALANIIEMIKSDSTDAFTRGALAESLALRPTEAAQEAMLGILEQGKDEAVFKGAALVLGEAANPKNDGRLAKLLDAQNEKQSRAAAFAVMLGGPATNLDPLIKVLSGEENKLVLRNWYEARPLFLTRAAFESGRIYRRIALAKALSERTSKSADAEELLLWPLRYMLDRLKVGWEDGPEGLTPVQVREALADSVRRDEGHRQLAAEILLGLGERGYLLALQAEKGPQSETAGNLMRALAEAAAD